MRKRPGEDDIVKTACYWAQQKMQILQKLQRAGIPCPAVVTFKRNTLVTSCVNSIIHSKPAPKLRDANIDFMQMTNVYEQVVHYLKVMYTECNLVPGKLSARNILWSNNKCYIIDVSQSVRQTHDEALLLLYMDCERIFSFFTSLGVMNIARPDDLFSDITGYDPEFRFRWAEYQKSRKIKSHAELKPNVQPV